VTEASHAVFLSYASEDAESAQRIAEALRAAGIEVWFDQSELRGGDIWDRRIREQIHDCRLFIAVISAHTEGRDEGYFRREWKLAVDRTHDMDERKAFSKQAIARLLRTPTMSDYWAAEAYAYTGDKELAFQHLERSYTQRSPDLTILKSHPLMASLRTDQRYKALLRKMNLPE
jgi:hypothetical protein